MREANWSRLLGGSRGKLEERQVIGRWVPSSGGPAREILHRSEAKLHCCSLRRPTQKAPQPSQRQQETRTAFFQHGRGSLMVFVQTTDTIRRVEGHRNGSRQERTEESLEEIHRRRKDEGHPISGSDSHGLESAGGE